MSYPLQGLRPVCRLLPKGNEVGAERSWIPIHRHDAQRRGSAGIEDIGEDANIARIVRAMIVEGGWISGVYEQEGGSRCHVKDSGSGKAICRRPVGPSLPIISFLRSP
jgi:hypothetical protein